MSTRATTYVARQTEPGVWRAVTPVGDHDNEEFDDAAAAWDRADELNEATS